MDKRQRLLDTRTDSFSGELKEGKSSLTRATAESARAYHRMADRFEVLCALVSLTLIYHRPFIPSLSLSLSLFLTLFITLKLFLIFFRYNVWIVVKWLYLSRVNVGLTLTPPLIFRCPSLSYVKERRRAKISCRAPL
jgi:hypothetical protein